MKEPTAPSLYPNLDQMDDRASSHRLQEVSQLKKSLEQERNDRAAIYKKYMRGVKSVDIIDSSLVVASLGMGIGGAALLSTIVAAPIVLGLEVGACVCGILSMAGKFVRKRLEVKARKHDEIRVLADSKINTIIDYVSAALINNNISDEEFRLITGEVDKYNKMKADIRAGARKKYGDISLDEEAKKLLIQQGRDEAKAVILKQLHSH